MFSYPQWVPILYPFISTHSLVTVQNDIPLQNTDNDKKKMQSLMLPFAGAKGDTMLKSMIRCIKRIVPKYVNTRITYTGHKLNTMFQIQDKTTQIHKHDLVYYVKCPDQSCNQDYLGETGRRIIERIADHRVKINIHIYVSMLSMKTINTLI